MRFKKGGTGDLIDDEGLRFKKGPYVVMMKPPAATVRKSVMANEGMRFKKDDQSLLDDEGMRFRRFYIPGNDYLDNGDLLQNALMSIGNAAAAPPPPPPAVASRHTPPSHSSLLYYPFSSSRSLRSPLDRRSEKISSAGDQDILEGEGMRFR